MNEVGTDEISDQCGASVRPVVEGIGLVKDNLGILLSGELQHQRCLELNILIQ